MQQKYKLQDIWDNISEVRSMPNATIQTKGRVKDLLLAPRPSFCKGSLVLLRPHHSTIQKPIGSHTTHKKPV